MFASALKTLHAARLSGFGTLAYLGRVAETWRQRRALARLDAARLRDIGLTRDEAEAEASRPVWDAPRHWRK